MTKPFGSVEVFVALAPVGYHDEEKGTKAKRLQ
jgi:hypothetical protein